MHHNYRLQHLMRAVYIINALHTVSFTIIQCLQVYGFIRNFTEMYELLWMKNAELRIWKHPAPPLFRHVV